MPAQKKYTDSIFRDIESGKNADYYGFLGTVFHIFSQITAIRIKSRMTQRELAKRSGMAQPSIARIESGRTNPSLLQVVKIANALGMKIKFEPMTKDEIKRSKDWNLDPKYN